MRYSYIAAWSVVGGINLPKDAQPIELYRSEHYRFVVTNTPDELLAEIDRGSAVGRLMLKGLFDQSEVTEFPVALAAEIEQIKAERATKSGSRPVLVRSRQETKFPFDANAIHASEAGFARFREHCRMPEL